jgi:hypothetical protein
MTLLGLQLAFTLTLTVASLFVPVFFNRTCAPDQASPKSTLWLSHHALDRYTDIKHDLDYVADSVLAMVLLLRSARWMRSGESQPRIRPNSLARKLNTAQVCKSSMHIVAVRCAKISPGR